MSPPVIAFIGAVMICPFWGLSPYSEICGIASVMWAVRKAELSMRERSREIGRRRKDEQRPK